MGIDAVPLWITDAGGIVSFGALFQRLRGVDYPPIWGGNPTAAIYIAVSLSFAALFAILNRMLKKHVDMNVFNSTIMKLLAGGAGVMLVFIYMNFAIDDAAFTLGQAVIDFSEVTYFLFFVMSAVMFVVIFRYASKETATRTEMLMIEASKKYIRDLEESYNTLRAIRHDYVNILSSFKLYIDNEDMAGLSKYYYDELSEVNKDLLHQNMLMSSLENIRLNEVKSILIYKCSQAAQHEIRICFEIREPIEKLGVSTAIVCQMLGILLDNAVEAALKADKKELSIAIVKNPNSTAFIIKNTWAKQHFPIDKLFELGFSTKQEGSGVGLYTVRNYTEKIKGLYLETETTDEHFTQILTVKSI
jgi:two-component system sensor histidine kinase AgrC